MRPIPCSSARTVTACRDHWCSTEPNGAYTRAGIEDQKVRGALVHQLRHTFATGLADQGVSVYELRQMLGHSSIQTTSRHTAGAGQETRTAAAVAANPVYRMLE